MTRVRSAWKPGDSRLADAARSRRRVAASVGLFAAAAHENHYREQDGKDPSDQAYGGRTHGHNLLLPPYRPIRGEKEIMSMGSTTVRLIAGVLAVLFAVVIFMRRRGKQAD